MAASTSAVAMAMPLTSLTGNGSGMRVRVRPSSSNSSSSRLVVRASLKEKALTGLTAAALTASMVVPQVAEAAESSGLTPSLNNFLLSIAAGGAVLVAIIGAVVGVSNFDPVNRS